MRSTLTVSPVAEYDGGEIGCEATNELGDLKHTFSVNVVGELGSTLCSYLQVLYNIMYFNQNYLLKSMILSS